MRPLVVAIVGAGPSGIYAAESLVTQSEVDVEVAVIDKLPVPFGLVRYGVAPDHPSIRSIRTTLERTLERPNVHFFGNVAIGTDLSIAELRGVSDAVIYAYGAASDQSLGVAGENLTGSIAAPQFVSWYCGNPEVHPEVRPGTPPETHPDTNSEAQPPAGTEAQPEASPTADPEVQSETNPPASPGNGVVTSARRNPIEHLLTSTQHAVVVGAGNVALDVVRGLIKNPAELDETDLAEEVFEVLANKHITDVHLLARRGPAYTSFTTKELRELANLNDVDLILDADEFELTEADQATLAGDKIATRNVAVMQQWLEREPQQASRRIHLHFWTRPTRIDGDNRLSSVQIERTELDEHGRVRGVHPLAPIEAELFVRSVGYRGLPLAGVPYDETTGRVPHSGGHVIRDGVFSGDEYVAGWIKRGPTGVIGTNKSDAVETVQALLADVADEQFAGGHSIDQLRELLAARDIHALDINDWHRIDSAEIARGHGHGRERTTIASRADLLDAASPPEDA